MRKAPDEKRHEYKPSEVSTKGEAIYRELKREGKLNGRAGKMIQIDTKYGFYGIGDTHEAHGQIEAQIAWREGKNEIRDPNWARNRVYIRRIGNQDKVRSYGEVVERREQPGLDETTQRTRGNISKTVGKNKPPIIILERGLSDQAQWDEW